MSDKLKSAYELAMEKLQRKDKASSQASGTPKRLTAKQKEMIAAIRRETEAKLAEREILVKSDVRAARGDFEQTEKIAEAYRRDRERLLSRQEERIKEVRSGNAGDS